MQFNSFIFILLFLPVTAGLYFIFNKISDTIGKMVLIVAGVLFYAYSGWMALIVLGMSLVTNYVFSVIISKKINCQKALLAVPVLINVLLLLYFKYINFAILNINLLFDCEFALKEIILPMGISFFTFQQIAYDVAIYRGELKTNNIIDYLTYILYFPKLLMGPLADPVDFVGQINDSSLKKVNWDNLSYGIKIFSFGLFKKMMIADVFSQAVLWGYDNMGAATSMDWILIMLFYTFEIYFDFSGYSDMAVGASVMLNITLPINFDSPYKAMSIRDFWKRWHISLTKFLTKYIYIPLGGSKKGKAFTYLNTMIVFIVSGIWHGANWTFILWGIIHGGLMIFDRISEKFQKKIFEPVRWMMTFGLVNVLWLLFRSDSIAQWGNILKKMFFLQNTTISEGLVQIFAIPETVVLTKMLHLETFTANMRVFWMLLYILAAFGICLIPENNYRTLRKNTAVTMLMAAIAFVWGLTCLGGESVFIYSGF